MKTPCDLLFNLIKSSDTALGDLRLKSAVFFERSNTLEVNAVSDASISSEGKDFILKSLKDKFSGVKINLNVVKAICDKSLAKRAILEYIKLKCFHVAHLIKEDSVLVLTANKKVNFELFLSSDIYDYFIRTSELENMCKYLSRNYSNDFFGVLKIKESVGEELPVYEVESLDYGELEDSTLRYVKVNSVLKYCDQEVYDTAMYIADGENRVGPIFFAGIVVEKEEKISKNGNPYYVISIDDKTGKISGRFFTKDKNKLKKLEKVEVGSVIIARGENELFNGSVNFTIKGYHFCEFPLNYTPIEKASKKAPERYGLVHPEKISTARQDDFFTGVSVIPTEIKEGVFTVVDIETTGTDTQYDKITEIGAVKIVNGVITESFQTLVNPEISISERITELTGIDDELVKNAPTIDKVYPDFFKFIENTVFVAHNADFDFRFLKNVGKALGYVLKNEVVDTLYLSRKILPSLKNHKLNTVCDNYGIEFLHHRALSDALATAELLLELVKGKKSLKDI